MGKKLTTEEFIKRAKQVHGDRYNYSLVEYKSGDLKVKIICPVHGVFEQVGYTHLRGSKCPMCCRKNITAEEFIERVREIHGDKYDYSLVDYQKIHSKIKIICPIHGVFEQEAASHLYGKNECPKCYGRNKTTEEFVKEAAKIHNNKYYYSLTDYKNSRSIIKIICPIHGVFEQMVKNHLMGKGCPKCTGRNKTTEEFIQEAMQIHGNKYDYSLSNYEKSCIKLKIICPIHGVFEQIPIHHLRGDGCKKCNKRKRVTKESFLERAKEIHGDKYNYSLAEFSKKEEDVLKGNRKRVQIICSKHGVFWQSIDIHLNLKHGCPHCNESKGENSILQILMKKEIKFIRQKKFDDCINPKTKRKLSFDFYLTNFNICIEYDGAQHFRSIERFGGEEGYKNLVYRDEIKNKFCEENGIELLRIRYDENIAKKLNGFLEKLTIYKK